MTSEGNPENAQPHAALREVRAATGLSQEAFAQLLGLSRPYIQAVELGQRPATSELARRAMVMTGVWHKSIFPGQPTALDLEGNRYGEEFYRRFRQCSPQEVTEKEIRDITDPLLRLVHVAASIGKTTLVSELIGEAVRHMGTAIADLGGLQKGEPSSFGNVRVGNLRENPALAAAIDFVDDGSLSDDQVIPLNEKGQAHPSPMLQIANPKIVLLESLKRELEESEKGEGKVKSPPACRLRK